MMMKLANTAQPAISQRRAVSCHAEAPRPASRRPILLGLASILPSIVALPSVAMILEEDDEDLVDKAKANRKARLEKDRGITRDFLQSQGIKDKELVLEVISLQAGIYKLAKSGAQLQDGNVKAVAATLSEPWVIDFVKASKAVGGDAASIVSNIEQLQASTGKGDVSASKVAYVELVSGFKSWTETNRIADKLVGL